MALFKVHEKLQGTSDGVMVNTVDKQAFTSEFDSHWVPNSSGLVLHLSIKLSKYNLRNYMLVILVNCIKIVLASLFNDI